MGRASLILAVPPLPICCIHKKTLFIHLRDESTRDTTQIALRPSLVSCNGHVPEDSSSSPPKRKDNNALTVHTSHRLSEKVLLSLLHHRLFLMTGL